VGGVAVNDIQIWDFAEPRDYDEQVKSANYETTSVYGFGHPLYYKNVIDVFRGEAEPETDGREGLKSLEVLIAAYLSARDGRTVSLPLEY
jgi:UDP-N-acetyl-2-amino-2-deoxyglucuronate dehydrogenase